MLTRQAVKEYVPEIVACLRPLDPARIILFGSGARDDRPGAEVVPRSYREKEDIYLVVAQALRDIRRRIPLDLIVHTRAMHAKFTELDGQFARHVLAEGTVIYECDHV